MLFNMMCPSPCPSCAARRCYYHDNKMRNLLKQFIPNLSHKAKVSALKLYA